MQASVEDSIEGGEEPRAWWAVHQKIRVLLFLGYPSVRYAFLTVCSEIQTCRLGSISDPLDLCGTAPATVSVNLHRFQLASFISVCNTWKRTEEPELLLNNLQSTVKTCVGQTATARSVHHPLAQERKLGSSTEPGSQRIIRGSSARISEERERDFTFIDSTLHLRTSGFVAWRADTLTLPSPLALESQT